MQTALRLAEYPLIEMLIIMKQLTIDAAELSLT
jgi:hypothetical protein